MALPLTNLLTEVDDKVTSLIALNTDLKNRVRELEKENAELRARIDNDLQNLQNANLDIEFLKMSHKLADSPDNIVSARRYIARLIRTIDKCISMLREE